MRYIAPQGIRGYLKACRARVCLFFDFLGLWRSFCGNSLLFI